MTDVDVVLSLFQCGNTAAASWESTGGVTSPVYKLARLASRVIKTTVLLNANWQYFSLSRFKQVFHCVALSKKA